jgi:signal transduction histidine kinase/ActR/RegA family two-component response regulator
LGVASNLTDPDSRSRRRSILQLALLTLLLVLGGSAGLIAYAWQAVDRQEATRETQLVRRTLERTVMRLADEVTSGAEWDDAHEKTSGRLDEAWIDQSFAGYYRGSFHHDLTLLIGADGAVRYAAHEGARTDPADDRGLAAAAGPWVRQVRDQELRRRAGLAAPQLPDVGSLSWCTTIVSLGQDVYLLGISTIAPTSGVVPGDKAATVVVTGWKLDRHFLGGLEQDLGVVNLRLVTGSPPPTGFGTAALRDPTGRQVAALTWSVAKPGAEVLRQAARAIAVVFCLLGLTAAVFGYRIRQLFMGLNAKDRALEASMTELVEARDQAQAASVAKSQFIANISHEIRTPLNGVLGMAQVLERDDLTATQHERVRIISQSGKALLAVLNDVLDISKIEAGKLDISEEPFELAEVIAAACDSYRDVAQAKGIGLSWSVGDEAAGIWIGDAARIRQVLHNLVSNAVKFTEAGEVDVEAQGIASGLRIRVRDQGIGIAAAKLPGLFEKFSQVDGSATRRFGGTGLGLAISRELITLMSGDISVESEEGKGSEFTICLPLKRAEGHRAADEAPGQDRDISTGQRLRILAAEDNEINQLVLQALLEPLDVDLVLVANGAQAVEAYGAQSIDLVLMDVQMPVMNGVEATEAIRALERRDGRPPTPIIALTANVMRHQLEEYAKVGMNSHVAKPIQAETFFAAISAALEPAIDDVEADVPGRQATW